MRASKTTMLLFTEMYDEHHVKTACKQIKRLKSYRKIKDEIYKIKDEI